MMGGMPSVGGLTGVGLIAVQVVLFAVGLVVAFAGERFHELIITVGAFLSGVVIAMLVLPRLLLTGMPGAEGYLLTGVGVLVAGGLAVVLVWASIFWAVFLSGAVVGLLVGASLTGVWNPLWIDGGLLIVGVGVLFFGLVAIGGAFVLAYAGQATGYHGLRDMAFRINELGRVTDSSPSEGTSGNSKFEGEGPYFDSGGSNGTSSGRSDPFIPENSVIRSGPLRAWAMTIFGILCFGVIAVISAFILGTPILAGFLHPTARAGVIIVLIAAACGRLAVRFYRPYIAVSTALSGSILTAIAITNKRIVYLLSGGYITDAVRFLETASTTFFGVMFAVFLIGSAIQLRHIRHTDAPFQW